MNNLVNLGVGVEDGEAEVPLFFESLRKLLRRLIFVEQPDDLLRTQKKYWISHEI